jgi:hypothetical protein
MRFPAGFHGLRVDLRHRKGRVASAFWMRWRPRFPGRRSGLALIEPMYQKPSSKGGLPPIPFDVMLLIHLLQQWFTLSDSLMEEMLIDTPCLRRFGWGDGQPANSYSQSA